MNLTSVILLLNANLQQPEWPDKKILFSDVWLEGLNGVGFLRVVLAA